MAKRELPHSLDNFLSKEQANESKKVKSSKCVADSGLKQYTKTFCKEDWTHIVGPQLSLSTVILYSAPDERKRVFNGLENQIQYFSDPTLTRVKVFGKWHDLPRKQAAYGIEGLTYKYSGLTVSTIPWKRAPILQQILIDVKNATNIHFNFVLINRYKDGKDKMGEHKDDEKELDPDVPIASLSLGQERDFILRHQDLLKNKNEHKCSKGSEKKYHKMILRDGMLLLMNAPTNQFWYHSLPPRSVKTCPGVRINLTFRKIV